MTAVSNMGGITISRASIEDAAELADFAARSFKDAFSEDNRPEDMQAHLDASYGAEQQSAELADPDVVTVLGRSGSALVAYAQVRRSSPPPCVTQTDPIELHRFYLDRSMHGTGLAATLMEEAFRVTTELGGLHLWLGVWERNPRAIAFYGKCGFRDVGSQFYMVGPDKQTDRVLVVKVDPGVGHSR